MAFAPRDEILLSLAAIKNILEPSIRSAKRHVSDDENLHVVTNYILIQVASFLEEYSKLEGTGADSEVRWVLTLNAPSLNRIRKWKKLREWRSSLLAHPPRDKYGQLTNLVDAFPVGTVPADTQK